MAGLTSTLMPPTPPNPDKLALRRQLRLARAAVPDAVRRAAGTALLRIALNHGLLSRHRRIGFYIPANGEIDCLPLLNRALWMGAECYLPIVPEARQRKLWFSRLGHGPYWSANRFGIPEYEARTGKVRVAKLDILFMPLLGFDLIGNRVGMGGGYYDASLAFLKCRQHWHKPMLIGLGFDAQKTGRIPRDPWDRPLDAVITESRFYRFQYR